MAREYPATLSRDEFESAIWLDFEGLHGEETLPSFAGTLIDGDFNFTILNEDLKMLEKSRMGLSYVEIGDFTERLVERAVSEGRVIVGYSEHDLGRIRKISEKHDENMRIHYRNANLLAKKFFKKNRRKTYQKLKKKAEEAEKKVGLKDYLKLDYVGYDYPNLPEEFRPSTAIANLISQCRKKSTYSRMTETSKQRLKLLKEYNEHDCKGMKHLVEYIFSRKPSSDEISH